jgi:hypothetical protein
MNTNLKILLGVGIGAGIGYFISAVIVEMINIKEQQNSETDFEYDDVAKEESEFPQSGEAKPTKTIERPRDMGRKTVRRNYSEIFKKNPDLENLVKKYNGGQEVEVKEDDGMQMELISEDEFAVPDEEVEKPISIVSMAEFANNDELESITLNYYDDDVVTDEHDNPIEHPEQILGDEALVSFGTMSEDEDVVYVKNLPKRAMYEVVRTNKNYAVDRARRSRRAAKAVVDSRVKEKDYDGEEHT